MAWLDARYRLQNVPRARTRRDLLGRDRLSWFPVGLWLRPVWRRTLICRRTLDANTVAQVEFYWPTYNPTEAFDFFEQTPVENVILREGVQIDYPGNTTGAVYEWMRVNELHVFATKLVRSPPLPPLARLLPCNVRPLNRIQP